MKIEIEVKDYLTDEQIQEAALVILERELYRQINKEASLERVLANLTGEYIFSRVCEHIQIGREEIERIIAENVKKALESDHIMYQVFRRKDVWDRSESPAVKILDDVLAATRPVIEQEVERRIAEYPFRELTEEIEDTIYGVICRKLRESKEE